MRQRRSIVSLLSLCLALATAAAAFAQPAGPPRVSPLASLSQTVGISSIEITYSRPFVNEREIYGGLVPYGEVWRTGANEATIFEISHDAKVEGKKLAAGTYALFTIPGESSWTVVFNREAEQWGAFSQDTSQDALRIEVQPSSIPATEMLTFAIDGVTAKSAEVHIRWAGTDAAFTVEFDTPAIAIEQARKDVKDPEKARLMRSWADYFHQEGQYLDEALTWQTEVAQRDATYWNLSLLARLQAANDDETAASATAAKALEAGKKALADTPSSFMENDLKNLEEEAASWGE